MGHVCYKARVLRKHIASISTQFLLFKFTKEQSINHYLLRYLPLTLPLSGHSPFHYTVTCSLFVLQCNSKADATKFRAEKKTSKLPHMLDNIIMQMKKS